MIGTYIVFFFFWLCGKKSTKKSRIKGLEVCARNGLALEQLLEASKEIDEDGIKQEKIELDLSTSFKTALCDCNVEKIDLFERTI